MMVVELVDRPHCSARWHLAGRCALQDSHHTPFALSVSAFALSMPAGTSSIRFGNRQVTHLGASTGALLLELLTLHILSRTDKCCRLLQLD